nr:hypothetical protein BaRGS_017872 [Batillaria attramentaria]
MEISLSANPSPRHHSASDSEALTREFFREWTLVSSRSAEGAELVPQDDDNAPNSPCPQTPGATGVGKSSLIGEMAGDTQSDTSNDDVTDDNDNVLVSVHLDDEESTVELIDCPVDTSMDALRPDAFLVVYSVSDRKSYLTAAEVTRHLRYDLGTDRTVYLVANKTDLRRQQRVTTKEGEQLAAKFDCRFLETSAVLRMNVDTLLVRVLEHIRGQLSPPGELTVADAKRCSKNRAPSPRRAIQFLSKLIRPSRRKQNMNNDDMSLKR